MVNKRAKGRRVEKLAKDILKEDGYFVETKNASRWQSDDFWGLFDILALKGSEVRLIQIKSNKSDFYKARKEIEKWTGQDVLDVKCEVWLKENYEEWRMETITTE